MLRFLTILFAISLLMSVPLSVTAAPRVMATIKPIHSLVANVMQGVGSVDLLIKGNHSPHTFTLRPSDMRDLTRADIIFWVGEILETPLQKILHNPPPHQLIVELIETPTLQQLNSRHDEVFGHQHAEADSADHHQHQAELDPHIWLSPYNAARLIEQIRDTLVQQDPANATQYQHNAGQTLQQIQQLDDQIGQQLTPLKDRPFVVFHDAYQHFAQYYQLNTIAAVTLSPDRLPGAKHISVIKHKIRQMGAVCVFKEPQFKPQLIDSIREGSKVKIATLDPLGADLKPGADSWFVTMRNLSSAISTCLSQDDAH